MKQIFQDLRSGRTDLFDTPCPSVRCGHLLIRNRASLVSAGTERMLVEFGRASLIGKVRQQPDKVRQVLDKIGTDGLLPTLEAVRNKLDKPLPLGYSSAGVVLEVGLGVEGFAKGDRVISNGPHAEVVSVPRNLCARIPAGVTDKEAAFTVVAAVGLQGIRLAEPSLGEKFVVTGLGLIGLLTVQLLRAHGCEVLGLDPDGARLELARRFGAETVDLSRGEAPESAAMAFSRGRGVDGVLITASTKSSEPVHQAAQMCRKRGRIILVGVTGLELSRNDFYEKELTFQVSCSYGPGRYDSEYEEKGRDYPLGFVRWTEQRNFEAVLDMMADARVNSAPLVSHTFPLDRAPEAYDLLESGEASLGILLEYQDPDKKPDETLRVQAISLAASPQAGTGSESPVTPGRVLPVVGFIGAGNFAAQVLIPAFKKAGIRLKTVASSGAGSGYAGRKFGFEISTSDLADVLGDGEINTVIVATRHDSHARFVGEALEAGKHVFVEKPLAIHREELALIESRYCSLREAENQPLLMVGFNRRFAPQTIKIKALLDSVQEPKALIMTVNAGRIPRDHWTQDPAVGGGRIIGEACHFIDLLRFLVGRPITAVKTSFVGGAGPQDNVTFILTFEDGSIGTIHYLSGGHKSFSKERLEAFCAGRILQLDNFRKLKAYGWPGFAKMNLWRQDKGHQAEVTAFVNALKEGAPAPIPFSEIVEITKISFDVADSANQGNL